VRLAAAQPGLTEMIEDTEANGGQRSCGCFWISRDRAAASRTYVIEVLSTETITSWL